MINIVDRAKTKRSQWASSCERDTLVSSASGIRAPLVSPFCGGCDQCLAQSLIPAQIVRQINTAEAPHPTLSRTATSNR
ncbi:MAG: hypothetical protein CM15mP74_07730 [Halieaceae bacterium]|nr:MAG: hypothetical protein CM15mP74_07730 [Halieaceae bacterium]